MLFKASQSSKPVEFKMATGCKFLNGMLYSGGKLKPCFERRASPFFLNIFEKYIFYLNEFYPFKFLLHLPFPLQNIM